jgi:hypothetical protein
VCWPWLVLQDYKAAQKVAAEREAQYLPKVPPAAAGASSAAAAAAAAAAGGASEADIESQALLQEQVQQESRAMENTISFQEALIEERDMGIAGGSCRIAHLRAQQQARGMVSLGEGGTWTAEHVLILQDT